MRMSVWLAGLAVLGLAVGGCGKEEEHSHGGGGDVAVPKQYGHAVEKCEELSKNIDDLIQDGHLHDVHAVAKDIQKIAEKLPELAKHDLESDALREVNVTAKKLAGTFSEIDEAADAGKKQETIKVHNKMKRLIAVLKKQTAHAKEEHEEEEHKEEEHHDH